MRNKLLYVIAIIVFLVDLFSKFLIVDLFKYNKSVTIIKSFFYINYVKNRGGAFSMLDGNVLFIIIVTIVIFFFIFKYLMGRNLNLLEKWGYGLIIGGAFGNLFDRVVYGYVIDFLDFYIFKYDFPVFNIADCGIVIGVLLIILYSVKFEDGDKVEVKS